MRVCLVEPCKDLEEPGLPVPWISWVASLRKAASGWEPRKTSFVSVLGEMEFVRAEDRIAGREEGMERIPTRSKTKRFEPRNQLWRRAAERLL